MNKTLQIFSLFLVTLGLHAVAQAQDPLEGYEEVVPAPSPDYPEPEDSGFPAGKLERGQYMVRLLGCGNCHTDGALIGEPDPERVLAGSDVGIAWTNPMRNKNPGVVYPANLTPHEETGLGAWTLEQIVAMLTSGINRHGGQALPVMPWQAYAKLTKEDAESIAMYLKSLPPVKHQVPAEVHRGQKAKHPFVHFGIYRSQE